MTRLDRVMAESRAEVYHLNGASGKVQPGEYVEISDAAVLAFGSLLFACAGALGGALLHI